jgi:hypothetical protein
VARRRHKEADARYIRSVRESEQQAAGIQGENALASWLSGRLSDDWIAVCGYRNRKGEADIVVVGPPGVWVIEVKNRNARLHVEGDQWWYQKMDRWGNVVENGSASDNGGRTWGRQVGDIADALAWWLKRNDQQVHVHTAVMLTHARASLGHIRDPGVDLVQTDPQALLRAMTSPPPVTGPTARTAIAKLIRRDHRYHNERRVRRD